MIITMWLITISFVQMNALRYVAAPGGSTKSTQTILHFPKDKSVGTVYLLTETELLNGRLKGTKLSAAQGDLTVPPDALVMLKLSRSVASDLHLLDAVNTKNIAILNMAGTDVTNDSTKCLAKFTALRCLLISDTDLSNDCMSQIIKVPTLEHLVMNRTLVTDLSGLSKLKRLNSLDVQANNLNDQTLREILSCKSIKNLNLRKTLVTDNLIRDLKCLPLLKADLAETKLTDKGVHFLSGIPTLKYLDINSCNITNAALPDLTKLRQLRFLDVQSTHVDGTGIEYFKRLSKDCKIESGPHIPKGHEGVHF